MKKLTKKELIKITNKLKPFWKKQEGAYFEFLKRQKIIENKINKKLNLNIKLEFFYCEGECVGIGAENYSDREFFPLIQDSDLRS